MLGRYFRSCESVKLPLSTRLIGYLANGMAISQTCCRKGSYNLGQKILSLVQYTFLTIMWTISQGWLRGTVAQREATAHAICYLQAWVIKILGGISASAQWGFALGFVRYIHHLDTFGIKSICRKSLLLKELKRPILYYDRKCDTIPSCHRTPSSTQHSDD